MTLIDSIKLHEGFRSRVYKCSNGFDTIGYGAAIKDLELDEDIAEMILLRQVQKIEIRIVNTFDWYEDTPEQIQDVIVEMCFQIGVSGFGKFKKTISYAKNKDWKSMSIEMLDSKWARSDSPQRAKELSEKVAKIVKIKDRQDD